MENKTRKDFVKELERLQGISQDLFPLESDEEMNTEKDVYNQLTDIINNIEDLEE